MGERAEFAVGQREHCQRRGLLGGRLHHHQRLAVAHPRNRRERLGLIAGRRAAGEFTLLAGSGGRDHHAFPLSFTHAHERDSRAIRGPDRADVVGWTGGQLLGRAHGHVADENVKGLFFGRCGARAISQPLAIRRKRRVGLGPRFVAQFHALERHRRSRRQPPEEGHHAADRHQAQCQQHRRTAQDLASGHMFRIISTRRRTFAGKCSEVPYTRVI